MSGSLGKKDADAFSLATINFDSFIIMVYRTKNKRISLKHEDL